MNTNNPDNAVLYIIDITTMSFTRAWEIPSANVLLRVRIIPRIMKAVHIITEDLRLFSDLKRCLIQIDFITALITNFSRRDAIIQFDINVSKSAINIERTY